MALQGTIKDFGLPDIFQLIGIQRKTGVLTLDNGDDTVTLKFLEGQVVGADTRSASLEERLGEVLVRTGKIDSTQLNKALEVQKSTLQRLGYILVNRGEISESDLVDALNVQSSQIIYRLFRWREGEYNFDGVENLEYDQVHFTPISSDTILMEGARMMDEWPLIERRIKSDKVILRKTAACDEVTVEEAEELPSLEDELELVLDGDLGAVAEEPEPKAEAAAGITISDEERELLELVDGRRSVAEIGDRLNLGDFDTQRILAEMVTRSLLEVAPRERTTTTPHGAAMDRLAGWIAHSVVAALVAIALATLPFNGLTPWRVLGRDASTDRLRLSASVARIEKLENAVKVFYLDTGQVPPDLVTLAEAGYLTNSDLVDPWGQAYGISISPGGYQIQGLDAAGQAAPALSLSRRFSAAQGLMLQDAPSTQPAGGAPAGDVAH